MDGSTEFLDALPGAIPMQTAPKTARLCGIP